MSSCSSVLRTLITKLPTPHPAILLTPIAIGAYMAAPAFAIGDTKTANVPAPILRAADAVRSELPEAKAPVAAPLNPVGNAPVIVAAPTAPSTVIMPIPVPGGGGAVGSNFGGGTPGSGGRIATRPAPAAPQANLSPPRQPTSTLPRPARPLPPPIPHPAVPPAARIPTATPPIVLQQQRAPVMYPHVTNTPFYRMQVPSFGRPLAARSFVGGGGFVRHH